MPRRRVELQEWRQEAWAHMQGKEEAAEAAHTALEHGALLERMAVLMHRLTKGRCDEAARDGTAPQWGEGWKLTQGREHVAVQTKEGAEPKVQRATDLWVKEGRQLTDRQARAWARRGVDSECAEAVWRLLPRRPSKSRLRWVVRQELAHAVASVVALDALVGVPVWHVYDSGAQRWGPQASEHLGGPRGLQPVRRAGRGHDCAAGGRAGSALGDEPPGRHGLGVEGASTGPTGERQRGRHIQETELLSGIQGLQPGAATPARGLGDDAP